MKRNTSSLENYLVISFLIITPLISLAIPAFLSPPAEVLDQLNTHNAVTLIEIFGKTEADRILSRIRFHHAPPDASWLNMAEIEIGVLENQYLDRRIPDEFSLGKEIVAWETRRNNHKATIQWSFTREKAEKTFSKNQSYSSS